MAKKEEKPKSMLRELLGLAGAAAFAGGALWVTWSIISVGNELFPAPERAEMTVAEQLRGEARALCMMTIQGALHDPSSAEWGAFSDGFYGSWQAQVDESAGTVEVRPRFRAKNAMGAMILSEWVCVAEGEVGALRVTTIREL